MKYLLLLLIAGITAGAGEAPASYVTVVNTATNTPAARYKTAKSHYDRLGSERVKLTGERRDIEYLIRTAKSNKKPHAKEDARIAAIDRRVADIDRQRKPLHYEIQKLEFDYPALKKPRPVK